MLRRLTHVPKKTGKSATGTSVLPDKYAYCSLNIIYNRSSQRSIPSNFSWWIEKKLTLLLIIYLIIFPSAFIHSLFNQFLITMDVNMEILVQFQD